MSKNELGNYSHCIECGCTTLVWNDKWKTCIDCDAVYEKKEVISHNNVKYFIENKMSCNINYCMECGCTTLAWNDKWKTCQDCKAVYAKRVIIT